MIVSDGILQIGASDIVNKKVLYLKNERRERSNTHHRIMKKADRFRFDSPRFVILDILTEVLNHPNFCSRIQRKGKVKPPRGNYFKQIIQLERFEDQHVCVVDVAAVISKSKAMRDTRTSIFEGFFCEGQHGVASE